MPALIRLLVVPLVFAFSMAGAQTLFGVSGNGSTSPGDLVSVDPSTGEITLISAVTDSGLSGVAILSIGMYATTISGMATTSLLIKLKEGATGVQRTTVGPITASGDPISISDLAVQPTTDVLYGIRSNADAQLRGGELYTIDVSTGEATLVGATEDTVGGGIGFAADGTLWRTTSSGGNSLVKISPVDASTIEVTMQNLSHFYDGVGVRPSDGLVFCTRGTMNFGTYVIDPLAKTETELTPGGQYSVSDLAFGSLPVPVRVATWGGLKRSYGAGN